MIDHANLAKTAIKHTENDRTYDYPDTVDMHLFINTDTRTRAQVKRDLATTSQRLQEYESDEQNQIAFSNVREAERQNFKNLSMRLYTNHMGWRYLWKKDSDEMDKLKQNLIYLNNLLDQQGSAFANKDGVNIPELQRKITIAFDEVINACREYVVKKKQQNQGKHKYGRNRLMMVDQIYKSCVGEKQKFIALADALRTNSFDLVKDEDIEDLSLNELTTKHMVVETEDVEYQNEGNSTDVYKIKVQENGKNVSYYIKENLPLLDEDVDGFVDRRLAQLRASFEAKKNKAGIQEDRLVKAKLGDAEYSFAIKFFEALKARLDNAKPRDKAEAREKVLGLLNKDFDEMFKEFRAYNMAADRLSKTETANDGMENGEYKKDDPNYLVAKFLREAKAGAGGKPVVMKKMTALEWITKEMGLSKKKDSDILKVFKEKSDEQIERLFAISAGKEVELYGQIKKRLGEAKQDNSAANNTATCELAKIMGFTDVVTVSDTRVVRFKDRTGKVRTAYCTVCEAAEGDEFINLIKEAEKDHKTIQYTPDAMRQLMRLQAFDTVCLQTDRHGRNFKCEVDRSKDGKLIITRIKSYDHDMSFGEDDIADTILKGEKNAFLPGLMTKAKKGTPLYNYIVKNYFKNAGDEWTKKVKPISIHTLEMSEHGGNDFISKNDDIITRLPWYRFYKDVFKNGHGLNDYTGNVTGIVLKRNHSEDTVWSEEFKDDYLRGGRRGGNLELAEERRARVLSGEEAKEKWKEVSDIIEELGQILPCKKTGTFEGKDRKGKTVQKTRTYDTLKTEFTKAEKLKVIDCIKKLTELNDEYDFRYIRISEGNYTRGGFVDLFLQFITNAYVKLFMNDSDPEVVKKMMGVDEDKQEALETLTGEDGDLEIPSLLHFDYDTYQKIKAVAEGNDSAIIRSRMKAVDFSDAKINAIRKRCQDTVEYLKTAERKAQAFYKLAGWDEKTAQGKFFLKKDEYAQIKDLSEMAVDPGQTYLSIDNECFLFGNKEFSNLNSEADIDQKIKETQAIRHEPKRWNYPQYLKSDDMRENREKFKKNALSGKIYTKKQ